MVEESVGSAFQELYHSDIFNALSGCKKATIIKIYKFSKWFELKLVLFIPFLFEKQLTKFSTFDSPE